MMVANQRRPPFAPRFNPNLHSAKTAFWPSRTLPATKLSSSNTFAFAKPDGTVVETPADSAQDVSSEIARAAPTYTDEHEKHVPVRGLAVGDTLEYRTTSTLHTPLAAGQFWFSRYFSRQLITLHETLELNVPK